MRRLRVLYVSHTAVRGGCSSSLLNVITNFPPNSVEAYVAMPPGPAVADFKAAGIDVFTVPGVSMFLGHHGVPLRGLRLLDLLRTTWNLRYGRSLRGIIQLAKPDLVHLNERGMLHAAVIAHREGIPVVMHARSVADRGTAWVRRVSHFIVARTVASTIAIDESVRWSVRELPRLRVIYNPASSSLIHRARQSRTADRCPRPVRVSFLSGLLPSKGIWDLLEAARLLRDRSDIVFQIAGTNTRSAEFHESWRGALARRLGLLHDVESAARAFVENEQLHQVELLGFVNPGDLLEATDILAFPSHLNGPGRSVFEAGILGIPSVVSLRTRIEDVVADGVSGLIVPDHDPQGLATAIRALADDPHLRERLGRAAQNQFIEQFDPKRIAQEVFDLYNEVLTATAHGQGAVA